MNEKHREGCKSKASRTDIPWYAGQSFWAYLRCYGWMSSYQLISMVIMGGLSFLAGKLNGVLIRSAGRKAITSGDFTFLFRSWQGYVILLIGALVILFSIGIDVNGKILCAEKAIRGGKVNVFKTLLEAVKAMKLYFSPHGFWLALYLAAAVPLTGIGISVRYTENFYIPNFISSVIRSNRFYSVGTFLGIAALVYLGIKNLFILHFILIEHCSVKEASIRSKAMMKKNWWRVLLRSLETIALWAVFLLAVFVITIFAINGCLSVFGGSEEGRRTILTGGLAVMTYLILQLAILMTPLMVTVLTRFFLSFREQKPVFLPRQEFKKSKIITSILSLAGIIFLCWLFGAVASLYFDQIFPAHSDGSLIYHRLGGNSAVENTLEGERNAILTGADGVETDIQRTKDGVYIIHHDNTFARLAGVKKSVSDLTFEEIRKLELKDKIHDPQPVATLEEVLDLGKDHLHLYLELKGRTADRKMADDVIAMLQEKDMVDQCTIIGLNYELMSYVNSTYPDVETGLLYYFAYGSDDLLDVDLLILEEEIAGYGDILEHQLSGRKVLVWTVNTKKSASYFLKTRADGLISDEVPMLQEERLRMEEDSDAERILDLLMILFGIEIQGR